MLSWIVSRFKRYRSLKRLPLKTSSLRPSHPVTIRVGHGLYRGDIVGGLSDKTLIELKHGRMPIFPERFEVRLEGDRTFRWVGLRWHHNHHVSVAPITGWAIAHARP